MSTFHRLASTALLLLAAVTADPRHDAGGRHRPTRSAGTAAAHTRLHGVRRSAVGGRLLSARREEIRAVDAGRLPHNPLIGLTHAMQVRVMRPAARLALSTG
jgi:hypothetical protein